MPATRRSKTCYSRVSFEPNLFQDADDFEINRIDGAATRTGQDGHADKINFGDEDQMEVYGYKKHLALHILTWTLIVGTGGMLRLIFHWSPHWMLKCTHRRCPLASADKVLVVETYHKHRCYFVKDVTELSNDTVTSDGGGKADVVGAEPRKGAALTLHVGGGVFKELNSIRMFRCKKLRYYWDAAKRMFRKLNGLDCDVTTADLHKMAAGLTADEQAVRQAVYGSNEIVIPVRGVFTLLFLEVLNPFYIFQMFSFCLWFADDYMYYAIAILLMSAFGIVMSIIQTRRNQRKLRSTVHSVDVVTVLRGNKTTQTLTTEQLVPGDVMLVPPHGCVMHCDAVLLTGNCIVNESMLTGESVPVTKTPLPSTHGLPYDGKEHARHTLFCGTQVIQTRYYGGEAVYALVIRTGFSTSKGSLVRSIMYPPPVDFKFEHDSYRFVELLALVASFGFIYTIITKHLRGVSASDIALEALDLITIVVPPALPAAMTVGRMYAQMRLQKKNVYCISPRTINVSGSLDCVCFDKTGTLTEDGLDMWGVIPIRDGCCEAPVRAVDTLRAGPLLAGMLTCHSITIIDGKLSGDPLDLKMLESTGWLLEEPDVSQSVGDNDVVLPTVMRPPGPGGVEIGVVRQFPFSSGLQRMSVITKTPSEDEFVVYCKGSPEMIVSLSRPVTVPCDFNSVLEEYTEEGYRVLAVACKPLPGVTYAEAQALQRDEVENDLTLVGLAVLENRLKPATTGVIKELRQAKTRVIMVTGDNMLTALSVARECNIVPVGQRVVLVHSTQLSASAVPTLYYTNSNCTLSAAGSCNGTISQNTLSTSVGSLATLDTSSVVIPDLDYSPSTEISISADYSFAITGATWAVIKTHYPELVPRMATRGAVFARMSPDQKQGLVQELQALGYYVAMCGDGANDCGALKAAHTGISLSDAESSVASPFTSKEANISCVPLVMREGRAALVTSFGIFKYMAAYSLTQFVSVMILYSIDTNLTDIEFLYIDLFLITIFAFFFGRTEAYEGILSDKPPLTSLISFSPVLSLLLHMTVIIGIQTASFYHVRSFDWFLPYPELHNITAQHGEELGERSGYENYAVFAVSTFQYIILAVIFSKGKPYRKTIVSNYGLLACLIVMTSFTIYLVVAPAEFIRNIFELYTPPDYTFPCLILAYAAVNLVVAYLIERFVIDELVFKKLRYRFHRIDKSKKKYLLVEKKMRDDFTWPVISKLPLPDRPPDLLLPKQPASKSLTDVVDFVRPDYELGDLPGLLDRRLFWSHRRPSDKNKVRRFSENERYAAVECDLYSVPVSAPELAKSDLSCYQLNNNNNTLTCNDLTELNVVRLAGLAS